MGSYVSSVLANDENIIYETRLHWIIYFWPVVFILAYGIGLIFCLLAFINRKTSEFAVTNRRAILKTGFIARKAFDISLDKVEGIIIEQGIFGRMLGYGTVIVRGTWGSSQPFHRVSDPFMFKRNVDEAMESRRTK